MIERADDAPWGLVAVLLVGLGLVLAVLSWWLAPEPYDYSGVIVGDDLCRALDGGCVDAGED